MATRKDRGRRDYPNASVRDERRIDAVAEKASTKLSNHLRTVDIYSSRIDHLEFELSLC